MRKLSSLFKHVDLILQSTSVEEVWAHHTSKMKEYGFNRLLYGSTRFWTHGVLGDDLDVLLLSNRDQGYIDALMSEDFFPLAPIAAWVSNNAGVHSWRNIKEQHKAGTLSEIEEKAQEINARWGITAGYTISFKETDKRSKGMIGLCAREGLTQDDVDALWEEMGDEIVMLNNLAHLKLSSLPHNGRRLPLTSRQREVLQWVADGKTERDIALIMNLSPATVGKHLRLARKALDAATTAQAVLKASTMNQLFLFTGLKIRLG